MEILLKSDDEIIVYEALRVLFDHPTSSLALGTLIVVYNKVFAMLKARDLDTGNFIIKMGVGVLNQIKKKDDLWRFLVSAFNEEDSRATAVIVFAMIKWGNGYSGRLKPLLEKWMEVTETYPLFRLESAIALCLLGNVAGLPVILAHLVKPKSHLTFFFAFVLTSNAGSLCYLKYPKFPMSVQFPESMRIVSELCQTDSWIRLILKRPNDD